ncbi:MULTISPECIES: ABC transporter ATP-binding protein [Caballeronia]|jgi:branched-chain amino acid transport system ATP-binding protein|uniref:ABC transporter n=1 Tax=Caballeronia grimmiae TaxID=1071679 RepID=A0A069NLB9_9BURK|nr:ABC transporter ATP-binding protein [Caballeronia grimmiae]KDR28364.1 ABC transporter [Caballeronia grimmiae]GGD62160.1 ABC transporter ATP-binding protein [Caballeronia grimmiae]
MTLLRIEHLSKSFDGVQAVDDVSFSLKAGELLALIGPNGAGKSTCFNMINGQLKPGAGSIELDGQRITGKRPRDIWRLGVGRTFQIAATFNSMTVLENVQMALLSHERRVFSLFSRIASWREDEAMALLDLVGMAGHAQRSCAVLAYGDVKRVELAVALANRPKLLLMDEPTAGMAPEERNALMALTARLAKERNIGVLFTEHSMDVVFEYADTLIVLARGKLIAQGDADAIRNDSRVREVYLGTGASFSPHAALNDGAAR